MTVEIFHDQSPRNLTTPVSVVRLASVARHVLMVLRGPVGFIKSLNADRGTIVM